MYCFQDFVLFDKIYRCLESCYWHLIEKRFCFDESIAMYEEPVAKEERNNNLFDNMAFYDSVSVIAGRAVVTIDPLPAKKSPPPVVQQPKRLKWREKMSHSHSAEPLKRTHSVIMEKSSDDVTSTSSDAQEMSNEDENLIMMGLTKKTVSFENMLNKSLDETDRAIITSKSENTLSELNVELKKKSLKDRRMSKSLYLKIGEPREVPIIRQNSVPKFYLETPERNQKESALIKTPLTSLQSPICNKDGFCYDLKSVVQIQKTIRQNSCKDLAIIHKESSRLSLIKERMKLKKSKSTVSASNIPHSNYI